MFTVVDAEGGYQVKPTTEADQRVLAVYPKTRRTAGKIYPDKVSADGAAKGLNALVLSAMYAVLPGELVDEGRYQYVIDGPLKSVSVIFRGTEIDAKREGLLYLFELADPAGVRRVPLTLKGLRLFIRQDKYREVTYFQVEG